MADQTSPDIVHPLCVYVLFHQESKVAEKLADYVFRWLRLHDETGVSGDNTGMGVPVYYRSIVKDDQVFPKIPWDQADRNVILVLSDDTMNVDPAWQQALDTLHKLCPEPERGKKLTNAPTRQLVPVMLSLSLNAIAFLAAKRNPLRVYDQSDPPGDNTDRWGPRLRRGLTELLVRDLYNDTSGAPPRLKTFISHAKDGAVQQAQAIRDGLLSVSKIDPWFDSNDVTPGYTWAEPMSTAAAHATGGLIAVVDPVWPTRPWCRHEAAVARTPRRVGHKAVPAKRGRRTGKTPSHPIWSVQPAVVARVVGTRWYRLPASVAQLPTFDCSDPMPSLPWIATLVDRLLLEHLLAELTLRYAEKRCATGKVWSGDLFLTFVPDVFTLEGLAREVSLDASAGQPSSPSGQGIRVLYPGHGLRPVEREELTLTAGALFDRSVKVEFTPLENADHPDESKGPCCMVGISAGGGSDDVRSAGIGDVHFNDLTLRLTRRLLSEKHRVAYGGTLTNDNNITKALISAAQGWRADVGFKVDPDSQAKQVKAATDALKTPPVINYAAWPHSKEVTEARRASTLGLVGYESFKPRGPYRGVPFDRLSDEERTALAGRLDGDALTAMRAKMATDCRVRVFFAGKVHGWSGWLPGLAEELLAAIEQKQRCVLIGGFGGLTQLLVEFLSKPDSRWPDELTWPRIRDGWSKDKANAHARWLAGTYEGERQRRIQAMETEITALRDGLHGKEGAKPVPSLNLFELKRFATVSSATAVVNYVARVANEPNTDPKDWLT